jgi:type II secretory pathway component PulK
MKEIQKNGFVLLFVIIIMTLISIVTFILTEDAKTILFQSNQAYLKAVERNLVVNGLAWAKAHLQDDDTEVFNNIVELDVTEMPLPHSILKVKVDTSSGKQPQVQINTSCTRARRTLEHSLTYRVN